MKITTIGLTALLGNFGNLAAIERPMSEETRKEIPALPAEPQGGILEGAQNEEEAQVLPAADKVAYLGVGGRFAGEALLMHLKLESGLLLSTIDPTSPAGLAGLNENDILVSLGDRSLTDQNSLRKAVADEKPGAEVLLKLVRRGEAIEQKITLGEALAGPRMRPLALVPNQAAEMNQLLERQLGNALDGFGNDELQRELKEQLERAIGQRGAGFKQLRFKLGGHALGADDRKLGIQQVSSMRLEDDEGSIEMKAQNGQREIIIRNLDGKVVFEGPYDSELDKAAVPESYQDRVQRLDAGGAESFLFQHNGE